MPDIVILSVVVLIASLAVSLALNGLFVRYGKKTREADMARRIHVAPVGKQGGIAMYLTLVLVIGGGCVAVWAVNGSLSVISGELSSVNGEPSTVNGERSTASGDGEIRNPKSQQGNTTRKPQNPGGLNQGNQSPASPSIGTEGEAGSGESAHSERAYSSQLTADSLRSNLFSTLSGVKSTSFQVIILLAAATVIFLLGVLDDRRGVRWRWKLLVQLGMALALAFAGYRTSVFGFLPGLDYFVSVLWMMGLTNAFNFLDGMDGLCGGVAAIACGILAFFMSAYDHPLVLMFLMAMTGSILGFLRYNFSPARIYMGDGGSTLLGFLLAVITLQASYSTVETKTVLPVLMPVLILAIPLYDTSSVILIRIWNRRSPFEPDTNHLHHRLKRAGMSDRQAVLFIWLMAFIMGVNATLLTQVDAIGGAVILVQALGVMGLFIVLERVVRKEMQAAQAGKTDRLLSVKARFKAVSTAGRPRDLKECQDSAAVAREFADDKCLLIPEKPLPAAELDDLFEGRSALKVDLILGNGRGNGANQITAICRLEGVDKTAEASQRLRIAVDKISGRNRRLLSEFVEEKAVLGGEGVRPRRIAKA